MRVGGLMFEPVSNAHTINHGGPTAPAPHARSACHEGNQHLRAGCLYDSALSHKKNNRTFHAHDVRPRVFIRLVIRWLPPDVAIRVKSVTVAAVITL